MKLSTTSKRSQQFFMLIGGAIVLALMSVAVIVSLYLRQRQGPAAPTAPGSQPQAFQQTSESCSLTFEVPGASPSPSGCIPGIVDIALVIDYSGSMVRTVVDGNIVPVDRLNKAKEAASSLVTQLFDRVTDPNHVKIGMATFGTCDTSQTAIRSNVVDRSQKSALLNQINSLNIPPENGDSYTTCTDQGIKHGNTLLDPSSNRGARQNSKKILLLLTDGRPYSHSVSREEMEKRALEAAGISANAGYQVITVGLGSTTENDPLKEDILKCMAGVHGSDSYLGVSCFRNRSLLGKYYSANSSNLLEIYQQITRYVEENVCLPPVSPSPSPSPLVCNQVCFDDNECASEYCYQPPMPVCPPNLSCPQVMPNRVCRNRNNPTSTTCAAATPTPVPSPLACNQVCQQNSDCTSGFCYQPPMPSCAPGLACPQVMPAKVCRNQNNPGSASCANATPTPTPTASPTNSPTPTPTPTNSPTNSPTATPTNSPTPVATATNTPEPTPTSSVRPTPSELPKAGSTGPTLMIAGVGGFAILLGLLALLFVF